MRGIAGLAVDRLASEGGLCWMALVMLSEWLMRMSGQFGKEDGRVIRGMPLM
jgi:hypothetical protein